MGQVKEIVIKQIVHREVALHKYNAFGVRWVGEIFVLVCVD